MTADPDPCPRCGRPTTGRLTRLTTVEAVLALPDRERHILVATCLAVWRAGGCGLVLLPAAGGYRIPRADEAPPEPGSRCAHLPPPLIAAFAEGLADLQGMGALDDAGHVLHPRLIDA